MCASGLAPRGEIRARSDSAYLSVGERAALIYLSPPTRDVTVRCRHFKLRAQLAVSKAD